MDNDSPADAPDDLPLACRRGQQLAALTLQSDASVAPDIHPRTLLDPPSVAAPLPTAP